MKKEQKLVSASNLQRRVVYLCLLAVGAMECLYATTYFVCIDGFFFVNDYFAENYLIIPCFLFLGAVISNPLPKLAKRCFLLGIGMAAWFMFVELWHGAHDYGLNPLGPFFILYLMAFPFAAAVQENKESTGLFLLGLLYVAAGLLMVCYTVLLYLGKLHPIMRAYVYWDGARLSNVWHPNITAAFLLLGLGFSIAFLLRTKARWLRACFMLAAVSLFICLSLTNSRTSILIGCAMMGGIALFALIADGGWKRWLIGLLAAVAVFAGTYLTSQMIYGIHMDYRIEKFSTQMESDINHTTDAAGQEAEEDSSAEQFVGTLQTDENTGETTLKSNSHQGSLTEDLRTLNGRTIIWKAAFKALADNPEMLFLGTKNVTGVVAEYGSFPAAHAHNSLVQILMNVGLFGFLFAVVYTVAVFYNGLLLLFNRGTELWQKAIVILTFCIFMAGMLEFYLFIPNYGHFLAFPYHLLGGYLVYWKDQICNL